MHKEIDPKVVISEMKARDEAIKRLNEQASKIITPKDLLKDQTVLILLKNGELITEKVFRVMIRSLCVYPSNRRTSNFIDMEDIVSVEVLN